MDLPDLDPQTYWRSRLSAVKREFVWSPGCNDSWQKQLQTRLGEVIGLPQEPRKALSINLSDWRPLDELRIRDIVFETRPGLHAFGYLIASELAAPGIVCIPGHSDGVDALVGYAKEDY